MLIFLTDIKTMEEYTFLAPLLLTIGGLIIGAILKSLLKHSRLPYTVGLFAIGIILGVMNRTGVFQSLPELHDEHYRFIPGNIDVLRLGRDIALVAMGSTVHEIVEAAAQLAAEGIDATVISVPSIRPCDTQALLAAIQSCPAAITVEEHNVNGGVGSLVAEVLAEAGCAIPLRRLGIPDGQYAIAADRAATRARHEIDAAGVVKHARKLLTKKAC